MSFDPEVLLSLPPAVLLSGVAAVCAFAALLAVLILVPRQRALVQHLRLLAEQGIAGTRAEAETTRAALRLTDVHTAERLATLGGTLNTGVEQVRTTLTREQGELRLALADGQAKTAATIGTQFDGTRALLEAKLKEMREGNEAKLAEMQKTVNEQLNAAVEKQMQTSFARVIDQFTAVQKAMGDVQAVTAQIGDIKRLFSNVKTRGGWGETQVRAMLDDVLPEGSFETNRRIRPESNDVVEFVVLMPMRGEVRPLLPIDAKFPVEDYERLLAASEAGDTEAERVARRGLERRIRDEAKKIQEKYIHPPVTVEFAVLYLPTDSLYAEVARIPGLIDDLGRLCRVLVMGPSLLPALLRTIQLGFVTLALEQKAGAIHHFLGATLTERLKMDDVLGRLSKQAGTMSNTIDQARTRTRAVTRKLKGLEQVDAVRADLLLGLEEDVAMDEEG